MNRPSRGERPSAATTRYVGCLVLPIRIRRSFTAICVSTSCSSVETELVAHLGLQRLELLEVGELARALLALLPLAPESGQPLHHLRHLFELLLQLVDLTHRGAAAVGDPHAPRSVDEIGVDALRRRHRADDRLDPSELLLADIGVLQL